MRCSSTFLFVAALCLGVAPCTLAADKAITYNLRTRIGDGQPVERQFVVPFGSSLRAPAAGSLSYGMEVADAGDGRAFVTQSLLDAMGNALPRTTNGGRFLRLSPGQERTISYTVCNDRVIQQESRPSV